ncbi:S1 RNA-binding domain-containing protein 1-like isoform X2 [Mizuhopecten yessoensis]|uniref:S1 RNA-binding domain-containing protein 1 n=2 Tax=Mizuhopecten yessoensis TaxID=6573 RepID=A0A210PP24_MIZYE|nr:S1 RNA-binding domain-containing protein 1-like isoform X2 [Mizuhopecten yessoensis]XP_021378776.1 S1 RNA-binding domain-containing protein 1-like isoform X2 [Mizuhopecten yessoensis]OWF38227.1 S1 RNA-binding domain-containing protein 1 [Mizuhopecten yessoensis]
MAKDEDDLKVTCQMNWDLPGVISERVGVKVWAANNVVEMLSAGDTIPFIARYRKERTGDMEVDKIREVERNMEELRAVETKATMVLKAVKKLGKLSGELKCALENSILLSEVEALYAPYKPGHKGTLAERARALGLEPLALQYINHPWRVNVDTYVRLGTKGLSSHAEVEAGVQHILADMMTKDKDVIDLVRQLANDRGVALESSEAKGLKKKLSEKSHDKELDKAYKYETYFNFRRQVSHIQPHQVLAINRGEEHKILSVTITYPQNIKHRFSQSLKRRWLREEHRMPAAAIAMVKKAIEDAFDRLTQPQMTRQIRSELLKEARKSSIEVFAKNLKQLLLMQPCRGKSIIGLDPGFTNGCKTAVISDTGKVLDTTVLYLRDHSMKRKILDLVSKHRCNIIAIGDGSGCRETEKVISDVIKENKANIHYCIVRESGASIYSVTDVAKQELPNLEPSLRSAVSIARRLLDPLAEFVKVDPKHIGVGQYQHDMPEKQMQTSLDSVVEECVSFVGVDVNTASEHLLRRTAGLTATRAKNIVEWREKNGAFINRDQIRHVKGVGPKSYEQCAGFIRVHNTSPASLTTEVKEEEPEASTSASGGRKRKATTKVTKAKKAKMSDQPNPLDMTSIHPESYPQAQQLLERIGVNPSQVGHTNFIRQVQDFTRKTSVTKLAEEFSVGEPTMNLIVGALQQPLNYDFREGFEKPLFRSGTRGFDELKVGETLTGKVENVTHFGAFVDVGVGETGLLHNSGMKGQSIQLGNRLEVKVLSLDKGRKRFGLEFVKFG